jgi:translation initiation factor IF-3
MRISEHDMEIKANKVSEFLTDGDLVRVELRMRGREQAFGEQGRTNLSKFFTFIKSPYKLEIPPKRMGGTWSATLAPSK